MFEIFIATAVSSRRRGRPRKRNVDGNFIVNVKQEILEDSLSTTSSPRPRGRPRRSCRKSGLSYSLNGTGNLSCFADTSECSSSIATSANASLLNFDIKPIKGISSRELVDVRELWDHYIARAEYHSILSTSVNRCSKSRSSRIQDRKALIEKITQLKRIEDSISQGIRQITTFEFFNYVNPLCPGLNDVTTEIFMISCNQEKVIQKDVLTSVVVPCRSTHHHEPPVVYYAVPPNVEENAKTIFLVVKVHIEQKYHYIGSARRLGRSRGEQDNEETDSPVVKRILYGVRKVACGLNGSINPTFGNHTVVLINSDTDHVDGISFNFTEEKWMSNFSNLEQFARIGNKLCSSGPIGLINFGISDEHVEYDWNVVESVMDTRTKRKTEQLKTSDVVVWYHYKDPEVPEDTTDVATTTRGSPSSDKENSNVRSSPRKGLRSPPKLPIKSLAPRRSIGLSKSPVKSLTPRLDCDSLKPLAKTLSPRKCNALPKSPEKSLSPRKANGTPKSPVKSLTPRGIDYELVQLDPSLPRGIFDRIPGIACPFTNKTFATIEELEEHLQSSYPVFKFEIIKSTPFAIHFLVSSAISRADWEKPPADPEITKKLSISASSPKKKILYAPPVVIPVKRKNELPKAQLIPYGEMSFVPPTYSRVPGPSSSKVYHSVIEDTCDWKGHLMERNIRDYIDDTPQEKEFMLLHNRFRAKYRHLIVGEKLTLDFYTKFVETCGMEMKKKRIRAHCVARLTRLVQKNKMTPTNMAKLTQMLYELGPNEAD
ncbi:unnamed protein product [Haemonchus placei]|uniref:SET domain-containing protein n=1 Tax=Haemonchus placei TaxID=6290 RepID=A0A158QNQ2_HAEPC|nr:unnamed protein product [Haemonchus placei]